MGIGNAAEGSVGGLQNALAQPFSLSSAMDTLSSVTEPKYQRDEDALRTRLANSGFRQGSEGFSQSMQDFQVAKDRGRAATAQQAFDLASALRNQPISELNALRTGAQPQMPQSQSGANVSVNPADITSPFANQYQGQLAGFNAGVANDNATTGALVSAATIAAMMF